jgi:hypothetical protein
MRLPPVPGEDLPAATASMPRFAGEDGVGPGCTVSFDRTSKWAPEPRVHLNSASSRTLQADEGSAQRFLALRNARGGAALWPASVGYGHGPEALLRQDLRTGVAVERNGPTRALSPLWLRPGAHEDQIAATLSKVPDGCKSTRLRLSRRSPCRNPQPSAGDQLLGGGGGVFPLSAGGAPF